MSFPRPLIELAMRHATGHPPRVLTDDIVRRLELIFTDVIANPSISGAAARRVAELGYNGMSVFRVARIMLIEAAPADSAPQEQSEGTQRPHRPRDRSSPWAAGDDDRLFAAIYRFGIAGWLRVSDFVGNGRTRAQCSQRWLRCLDPSIKRDRWAPEENATLRTAVWTHGDRAWSKVARELNNRTDVQCRYHYIHHIRGEAGPLRVPMVPAGMPVITAAAWMRPPQPVDVRPDDGVVKEAEGGA